MLKIQDTKMTYNVNKEEHNKVQQANTKSDINIKLENDGIPI